MLGIASRFRMLSMPLTFTVKLFCCARVSRDRVDAATCDHAGFIFGNWSSTVAKWIVCWRDGLAPFIQAQRSFAERKTTMKKTRGKSPGSRKLWITFKRGLATSLPSVFGTEAEALHPYRSIVIDRWDSAGIEPKLGWRNNVKVVGS